MTVDTKPKFRTRAEKNAELLQWIVSMMVENTRLNGVIDELEKDIVKLKQIGLEKLVSQAK